jgi:putative flippase GtrA
LTHELATFVNMGLNNLNRVLPKRFHGVSDEVVKFGLIGVLGVVVNLTVFNVLLHTLLDNGEVKAKAVATVVATTCAYFLNRHWTYRDRAKSAMRREYTLFLFFNGVGLVIEVAVVWIAKYGLHQTSDLVFNICTAIGIVLGTVFRFWAYRNHVFKFDADDVEDEPALVSAAAALASVPDPAMLDQPHDHGKRDAGKRAPKSVNTADDVLHAELTQIELDDIVAGEQSRTPRT